jgi:hypothetical protein
MPCASPPVLWSAAKALWAASIGAGMSAPQQGAAAGQHRILRSQTGADVWCNCTSVYRGVAYAHQFESFCLVIRPTVPMGSVESVAFALQKGACNCLELDASDLGVSWRYLRARFKIRLGQVLSKGFCEHDGCETKRIQLI